MHVYRFTMFFAIPAAIPLVPCYSSTDERIHSFMVVFKQICNLPPHLAGLHICLYNKSKPVGTINGFTA